MSWLRIMVERTRKAKAEAEFAFGEELLAAAECRHQARRQR